MTVRALDKTYDWTFGKGKANYINKEREIKQDVITRIKSFKYDWFLDVEAEIDWIGLLGTKNNQSKIEREIERVVLATDGVLRITNFEVIENRTTRNADIYLSISTIYSTEIYIETQVI